MKIQRLFSNVEEEKLYSTGNDELDELLERAFCEGYEYAQKTYSLRHRSGIIVDKNEVRKLRSLNYPKLYVGFLEKVNPLVQEFSKLIGEDSGLIHASVPLEDVLKEKFPTKEEGPYTKEKDGKTYHCFFYDDLDIAGEFGYSEINCVLWCDNTGNNWYKETGLFFKKFEKVNNPKEYLKSYYTPEYFDSFDQRELADKICNEIDKL